MKILKNRLVLGCICVILALLIGFLLVPMFSKMSVHTVDVVIANEPITEGTKIEENMLKLVKMTVMNLPEKYYSDISEVAGKYSKLDMLKDDVITKSKIQAGLPFSSSYLYSIPKGKYAISVPTASLAAGLTGKVKEGDIVTILINFPVDSEDPNYTSYTYDELMYVKVLSISNNDAQDIVVDKEADEDKSIPVVVTVEANLEQSRMLSGFSTNATIHLALAARGETSLATELLKKQDEYFTKMDTATVKPWYYIEPVEEEKPTTKEVSEETTEKAPAETTAPAETAAASQTEVSPGAPADNAATAAAPATTAATKAESFTVPKTAPGE